VVRTQTVIRRGAQPVAGLVGGRFRSGRRSRRREEGHQPARCGGAIDVHWRPVAGRAAERAVHRGQRRVMLSPGEAKSTQDRCAVTGRGVVPSVNVVERTSGSGYATGQPKRAARCRRVHVPRGGHQRSQPHWRCGPPARAPPTPPTRRAHVHDVVSLAGWAPSRGRRSSRCSREPSAPGPGATTCASGATPTTDPVPQGGDRQAWVPWPWSSNGIPPGNGRLAKKS
jgi:hypothetical protein